MKQRAAKLNKQQSQEFCQFLIQLHQCPASSAGIERWFSTVGFIWSKVRNRLGVEKAKKLATIYRALRPEPQPAKKKATADAVAEGHGQEKDSGDDDPLPINVDDEDEDSDSELLRLCLDP